MSLKHGLKYKLLAAILMMSLPLSSAEKIPYELKKVGIEEHLGDRVSLDLTFINEEGKSVPLKHYIQGNRPVILTLVYYNCPNLCHYLLDGLTASLQELTWSVGEQFDILTISIDPTEDAALAKKKKDFRIKKYGRPESAEGWHFLTGTEKNIRQLADEVGFRYRYDTDQQEYAHTAAIFVLTPNGKISRYLYGVQFKKMDLKLSLMEAGEGKIGNVVDKLLLFCYHYDPKGRKYAIFAMNLMKLGGAVVMVGILALLFVLSWQRKRRKKWSAS